MNVTGRYHTRSLPERVFGTFLCILLYRVMSCIPLPFIDTVYVKSLFDMSGSFGMLNVLTGGNLSRMSVAALGISPYITASIFVQIFSAVIPSLSALQKAGAVGKKHIQRITLWCSVVAAFAASFGMMMNYYQSGVLTEQTWYAFFVPCVLMILSSVILTLLGMYIDEHLFGNGISLFLLAGIIGSIPSDMNAALTVLLNGSYGILTVAIFAAVLIIFVLFVCWMTMCELDLPLMYSRKSVADTPGVDEESVLPLKMLSGSVMPVIFASSFLAIPTMARVFFDGQSKILDIFDTSLWLSLDTPWASLGIPIYFLLIFFFSWYTQLMNMNEVEMADNLRNADCVIEGVSPGKETEIYLKKQMKALNRMGSIGLCLVAFLPILAGNLFHLPSVSLFGTTMIIIVSVLQDTWYAYRVEKKSYDYTSIIPKMVRPRVKGNAFLLLEKRR